MMTSAILRAILGNIGVRSQCKLQDPFRLQFMDTLLTSINKIKNKYTIKIIHMTDSLTPLTVTLSGTLNSSNSAQGYSELSSSCSSDTIILFSPESTTTRSSDTFITTHFSYDAELKLEHAYP